jgi:hypothetical protein
MLSTQSRLQGIKKADFAVTGGPGWHVMNAEQTSRDKEGRFCGHHEAHEGGMLSMQ